MDMIEPPKGNDDPLNYNPPNIPSDWNVNQNNITNTLTRTITTVNPMVDSSACSSSSVIDSFCFPNWDHPISGHNLGYNDTNLPNNATTSNTFPPKVPVIFPQNLPHFPDSSFIERAARFSCFSGGNFGEMMNMFSNNGSNEALGGNGSKPKEGSLRAPETEGSPFKDEKRSESFVNSHDVSENRSDEEGSKKRKRIKHNEQKGGQSPSSSSKPDGANGKKGCEGPGPLKEDYIHIRARRGQATNSHSLAERVRREKISERMKFLQDLVPGCSKVTGKAVMLDEIINYVQSLQRQVEFLSMKLSTVNPRMDFNIEDLLAKDTLQPRIGLSSSLPFPPDMSTPFSPLHLSQPGLIEAGLSGIGNTSEALRRPMTLQSNPVSGGFKEPTYQVLNVWEDELHNIVHMGFNTSSPHTKPEP